MDTCSHIFHFNIFIHLSIKKNKFIHDTWVNLNDNHIKTSQMFLTKYTTGINMCTYCAFLSK